MPRVKSTKIDAKSASEKETPQSKKGRLSFSIFRNGTMKACDKQDCPSSLVSGKNHTLKRAETCGPSFFRRISGGGDQSAVNQEHSQQLSFLHETNDVKAHSLNRKGAFKRAIVGAPSLGSPSMNAKQAKATYAKNHGDGQKMSRIEQDPFSTDRQRNFFSKQNNVTNRPTKTEAEKTKAQIFRTMSCDRIRQSFSRSKSQMEKTDEPEQTFFPEDYCPKRQIEHSPICRELVAEDAVGSGIVYQLRDIC